MEPNSSKKGIYKSLAITSLILLSQAVITSSDAAVTPPTVETTLSPGTSTVVAKSVDTPPLPPKLDLLLMVDLSGSYNNDLPNIKSLDDGLFDNIRLGVADSRFGLSSFVDFPFLDWGDPDYGDYPYQLDQTLTYDKATWTGAVDAMVTRSGYDSKESQYTALYQSATGAGLDVPPAGASLGDIPPGLVPDWRADATKVIAITTDAPFHLPGDGGGPFPYPGPSRDDTVNALTSAGIKVLALKAPGSGAEMDDLANATGGAVETTNSTSSDIADAILAGLEKLPTTVIPTAVGCGPINVGFIPATDTVTSGETAHFSETIAVPDDSGLEGSTINCQVDFHDEHGNLLGSQALLIMVRDVTPPQAACLAGPNPAGNIPKAGVKSPGQNEDGFYRLNAVDNVDSNPAIYMIDNGSGTVFGPFTNGTNIKYTQAPGAAPSQKPMAGGVDWQIKGQGDFAMYALDSTGNQSGNVSCLVPPPPK